jgi:hypothetical protein
MEEKEGTRCPFSVSPFSAFSFLYLFFFFSFSFSFLFGLACKSALHVSEYTDVVDTIMRWDKHKRMLDELGDFLNTLQGLSTCYNYRLGAEVSGWGAGVAWSH